MFSMEVHLLPEDAGDGLAAQASVVDDALSRRSSETLGRGSGLELLLTLLTLSDKVHA